MSHFPIIESLSVSNYRLYPGKRGEGLRANFGAGPWIVLGVNGLGKSTLLLMLRYVLLGPVRVRPAGFAGEGRDLLSADPRIFASRVLDGAKNAQAELSFKVGRLEFTVTRALEDLALVRFSIGETTNEAASEDLYREALCEAFEISDFANVVRLVDRLVFAFLENEAALIWDTSSQYEIFRALVLSQEDAARLRELEGTIISSDSAARNLNAVLFGIMKRQDKDRTLRASAATVRAQLAKVNADLGSAQEKENKLQSANEASEVRRSDARNRLYKAERAVDDAEAVYEGARFAVLNAALSGATPTQKYVLLKVSSQNECIVCGSDVSHEVEELEARRSEGRCLICGSKRDKLLKSSSRALDRAAHEAFERLQTCRAALFEARAEFNLAEVAVNRSAADLQQVREQVYGLERTASRLTAKLPKKDRLELNREKDRIRGLRAEVTRFRQDREEAEREIAGLIETMRHEVEALRGRIEAQFQRKARQFFTERVKLVYAPRRERIGQQGNPFEFPAFEIDMTSGATDGEYTRRTRDSISLSQRQYLDILFRTSIMDVLGKSDHSFVVDGPEGSLDAVFARRAGELFAGFSNSAGRNANNVIVACNVVDGDFIPTLLHKFPSPAQKRERIVNLLELGTPTAALRDLNREYASAVTQVLKGAKRA